MPEDSNVYSFYISRKATMWSNYKIEINAPDKESAIQLAKKIADEDDLQDYDSEEIYDTYEHISPDQNYGFATSELYDNKSHELLWDNSIDEV